MFVEKAQDASRNPRVGEGRLLRLLRALAFEAGARFVLVLCFLGLRCADAGHPPGLFAE